MVKVLAAIEKPFAAVAVKDIREIVEGAGMELALLEKHTEKVRLLDAARGIDTVIIRSDEVDAEVLDAAKNLKIVVRIDAGCGSVDLDAATARKVCVVNTPGQNSNAVTELAFGMLVYGARNFYSGASGTELKGEKLGIPACGNVGRSVARIAESLDMKVHAYGAFCPASVIKADDVKAAASMTDLFKACRIVSLYIPATAETEDSASFELMNFMLKGAIIMNAARKEVMDEADPAKMLEERPDFRYLADIIPAIHTELAEKYTGRYFSAPKRMGIQTAETNINVDIAAAKQIVDFLVDGNEERRVNR